MKGIAQLTSKQRDAVEAQARLIAAERVGDQLKASAAYLSEWLENPSDGVTYVTKLTVKPNWGDDGDLFMIINAVIDGRKRVAFHGGSTLADALIGLSKRLANGSMKWREDKPYDEQGT